MLQDLLDHDMLPYILLGVALILLLAVSCCNQTTVSSKIRQINQLFDNCRKPPSNPQDIQPLQLEELLEGIFSIAVAVV